MRRAIDGHSLEAKLPALQKFFGECGIVSRGAHALDRTQEGALVVHAERRFRAHAFARFDDERVADFFRERSCVVFSVNQSTSCDGKSGARKCFLHASFVAEQVGYVGHDPGDLEMGTSFRELHHQDFEDPQDMCRLSVPLGEHVNRLDDFAPRERVVDADHVVEETCVLALGRRVNDAEKSHVVEFLRSANEAEGGLEGEGGDENDVAGHGPPSTLSRASAPGCSGETRKCDSFGAKGRYISPPCALCFLLRRIPPK